VIDRAHRLGSLAFAVLLTSGLVVFASGPAVADCNTGAFNTEDFEHGSNVAGVRVVNPGMDIFDTTVVCVRISSIGILNSTGNFAETGWYEDPGNVIADGCPASGSHPHYLQYAVVGNNTHGCLQGGPTLTGGDTDGFRVSDDVHDGYFFYYFNGNETGYYFLPFLDGQILTNGERHNQTDGDTAHANFTGLQHSCSIGCWTDWTNPLSKSEQDGYFVGNTFYPYFIDCEYGPTHVSVRVPGNC